MTSLFLKLDQRIVVWLKQVRWLTQSEQKESATTGKQFSLDEVEALASRVLAAAGASPAAASAVARSIRLAERDGIRSHGLLYLPIYAEHLRCGKVLGLAEPKVSHPKPGSIRVDAGNGFAHTAIDASWECFTKAARVCGIAALTLHRSYNLGVLGHHAERLAAPQAASVSIQMRPGGETAEPPGISAKGA